MSVFLLSPLPWPRTHWHPRSINSSARLPSTYISRCWLLPFDLNHSSAWLIFGQAFSGSDQLPMLRRRWPEVCSIKYALIRWPRLLPWPLPQESMLGSIRLLNKGKSIHPLTKAAIQQIRSHPIWLCLARCRNLSPSPPTILFDETPLPPETNTLLHFIFRH